MSSPGEPVPLSNPEEVWSPSTMMMKDLMKMVADGVLPPKDIIGWREAVGELFPTTETEEIVIF